MQVSFVAEEYRRAVRDYRQTWRVTDQVLYDLCRNYFSHPERPNVHAKLWIIGRTYATGIERKVPTDGRQGGSLSQVAELFLRNGEKLDGWFGELSALHEPLTVKKMKTIVRLHGKVVKLLSGITRNGQSSRAFVSKYMHFHCPAVPIFDSFVYSTMPKMVPWQKSLEVFGLPADADEEYAWYAMRFWNLCQQAQAAGVDLRVKYLDYYILCVAERLKNV